MVHFSNYLTQFSQLILPSFCMLETHLKGETVVAPSNIVPLPRNKLKMASKDIPKPSPRKEKYNASSEESDNLNSNLDSPTVRVRRSPRIESTKIDNNIIVEEIIKENIEKDNSTDKTEAHISFNEEKEHVEEKGIPESSKNNIASNNLEIVKEETDEQDKQKIEDTSADEAKSTNHTETCFNKEPNQEVKVISQSSKLDNVPNHLAITTKEDNLPNEQTIDREIQKKSDSLDILKTSAVVPAPVISQIQKNTHLNIFSSPEFLGEKKPPEVIGVIAKTPEQKHSLTLDSLQKQPLPENAEVEMTSLNSRLSIDSYTEGGLSTNRTSINSALEYSSYTDDLSDSDRSSIRIKNLMRDSMYSQLYGIHSYDYGYRRTDSVSSLRSLQSLPGFFNNEGLKKWNNLEDLDDISLAFVGPSSPSVTGDRFNESGMFISFSTLNSVVLLRF